MKIHNWLPKSPINLFVLGVICGALLFWMIGCGTTGHVGHSAGYGTMGAPGCGGHGHSGATGHGDHTAVAASMSAGSGTHDHGVVHAQPMQSVASTGHGEHTTAGVSMNTGNASHNHETAATAPTLWTCPMHPDVQQSAQGQCPICGMNLVLQEASGQTEPSHSVFQVTDHDTSHDSGHGSGHGSSQGRAHCCG